MKATSRVPSVARPAFRPTLEALDDRLLLSVAGGIASAGALMAPMPTVEQAQKFILMATTQDDQALIHLPRHLPVVAAVANTAMGGGAAHPGATPAETITFNF
jgi:hypothetical protein